MCTRQDRKVVWKEVESYCTCWILIGWQHDKHEFARFLSLRTCGYMVLLATLNLRRIFKIRSKSQTVNAKLQNKGLLREKTKSSRAKIQTCTFLPGQYAKCQYCILAFWYHSRFCFLQIPLVFPFSALEFKHRVEAVKSALMIEMDAESARDMRNYSLARRRDATCKEMLSPQIEKAACTLGILGLWPLNIT